MRISPLMRAATLVLLAAVTSTTVYSQTTKTKKNGGSGSMTSGDQSGSGDDSSDNVSGGTIDKTGSKDASQTDDKSKSDTSKTGFDDGAYAEATAITYKAMQSIASKIADKKDGNAKTFVVFDPTTFATIAQYRITFPQVVLLRTSFCAALKDYGNATTKPENSSGFIPKETAGASQEGSLAAGLTPAGQIVDLAQKVLTMLQTTTTIAGASVNVTDEALVAEVASRLASTGVSVYYPGEFLLPELGDGEIGPAVSGGCTGAPDFDKSHHIVPEIVRLGVARANAAQRYQILSAALNNYNAVINPPAKNVEADSSAQNTQANPSTDRKAPKRDKKLESGGGGAAPAPPPAADPAKAHQPTAPEKADALKVFSAETGFTDTAKATGFQPNLKAYMDAYDALLTTLAVTDPKGQSLFSKLVIAERLNMILKAPKTPDPADQSKTVSPVDVVIVKWLRAGALNKTRKNLFFLGQRNYYAGSATGLYEYFDGDQKMLASGTITETSPYVHDKDFDNKDKNKNIDLINLNP